MHFDNLLARADDEVLQTLIGQKALRLLKKLDPSLASPTRLRDALLNLHGSDGLLASKEMRSQLFELLREKEAQQLAQALGVNGQPNPFDALNQASIHRNSSREEKLFRFFGLNPPRREKSTQELPRRLHQPAYALFDHQRRAAHRIKRHFQDDPRRVILHMPTGSGKTRTAMNIIVEHLREHEPSLVIWLAYSEELCEQAATEFEKAWRHLGNREIEVHRFWGARDLDLDHVEDGFMVAGLGKMYALSKGSLFTLGQLGSRCSLVIMDEAHQAVARTYALTLESLLVHHTTEPGLLGLTATPGRSWSDISEDERLADFFDRQKVILEVEGYDNPIDYLVDEGYLADAQFESLFVESGVTLSPQDQKRLQESLDISQGLLEQLAEDETRNLHIIDQLIELAQSHKRILFFAATVEHAQIIAKVLQTWGLRAVSITGETPQGQRQKHIKDFKKDDDEVRILCNYGVLTTGFDAPQTSAALISRPTSSLVLYSQMVGRAIRGPKAGGNAEATIVTVVDTNLPGFCSVADAFTNWEDVWEPEDTA